MRKNKWFVLLGALLVGVWTASSLAQELPILWEDHFEDDDPPAFKNVGWLYYGESDGLVGQIIEQRSIEGNGVLYIKSGNYQIVGVGLVETNGVPEVDPNDLNKTHRLLVANNYSSPNQVTTFRVNFRKITSSVFVAAARMVQTDTSEKVPDADPTQSPAYVVFVSPLQKAVALAKYEGPMAALQPESWTYFGQAQFNFELGVFYWFKFLLKDADFKVKIWEGELTDEPENWLIEAQDPAPRVSGTFNMFALFGQPPGGDEILLDDIVVRSAVPTGVETERPGVPAEFALEQNYPNPFNPRTAIVFALPKEDHVRLTVHDATGRLVRALVDQSLPAGQHRVWFDGHDANGKPVASGVYLYTLEAGGIKLQRKMTLVR
ncbi:MAG: T9SS type A sorting domain-containing protein [candidate division KSB1 bacterium]|nr:T9SS type A sorting domain-containing protein [candidate division KSB1 bacterium]